MRDLVRTRDAAVNDLRAKRQRVTSFLLRYGRSYPGRKTLGRPLCRMLRAVLSRCWRLTAPHGVICDLRQQRSAHVTRRFGKSLSSVIGKERTRTPVAL